MKYLTMFAFCVACICMEAQTQTSALYSIAPAAEPPTAVFIGQLWLNTTVGRLEWLSSLSPVTWLPTAPASVTGSILLITSGTCPAGTTEATELDGVMLRGTLTAHGNVGTTGGSDTITPTIASLTAAAQTFTGGSNTTSAVSAGTPAGTNGTVSFTPAGTLSSDSAGTPAGSNSTSTVTPLGSVSTPTISWPAGVPTNAGGAFSEGAISWPVGVPTFTGSSGTVPAETFTGSSATTSAVSAGTPAGTVSQPTFTGNAVAAASTTASPKLLTGNTSSGVTPVTTATGTVSQPTFTGSALATHTHTLTATGTNGTVSFTPAGTNAWPAGVPTIAAGSFTQPTISWPVGVPTNSAPTFTGSSSTVGAQTFTGSALGTHTHTFTGGLGTIPAETFTGSALGTHIHTVTPTGTNGASAVTGTLNSFDNRPAYLNVIFCKAN